MPVKTKISIIYTGGTIGGVGDVFLSARRSKDDFARLLEETECIADDCSVEISCPVNKFSECMLPADWLSIAKQCQKAAKDCDGIIIVHGTDTLCYTASALAFMLGKTSQTVPIFITGSNAPLSQKGDQAAENIRDCFTAIKSGLLSGVYVCFAGFIHAAVLARKVAIKGNSFNTIATAPLANIADGQVRVNYRLPITGKTDILEINDNIGFYKIYPGFKASLIGDDKSDAIILELYNDGTAGCGLDGVYNLEENIAEFGKPVFAVSQQDCPVTLNTYGTSAVLAKAGVTGLAMIAETAIVKLMWLSAQGLGKQELIDKIKTPYCGENIG